MATYPELFDSTSALTRPHTSPSDPSRSTYLIGQNTNWRTRYHPPLPSSPWPVAASIPLTLAGNHSTAIAAPSCRRFLCIDRASKMSCSSGYLLLTNGQDAGYIVSTRRGEPLRALEAGRKGDASMCPPRRLTRTSGNI